MTDLLHAADDALDNISCDCLPGEPDPCIACALSEALKGADAVLNPRPALVGEPEDPEREDMPDFGEPTPEPQKTLDKP